MEDLARRVLTSLDERDARRQADPAQTDKRPWAWELATRLEAFVALEDHSQALATAERYVDAPGADGFRSAAPSGSFARCGGSTFETGGSGRPGAGAAAERRC